MDIIEKAKNIELVIFDIDVYMLVNSANRNLYFMRIGMLDDINKQFPHIAEQ